MQHVNMSFEHLGIAEDLATISEYIRNPNMKVNEYGKSEFSKSAHPLKALLVGNNGSEFQWLV